LSNEAKYHHPTRSILFITHNRGGGTETHLKDLVVSLENAGVTSFVVRPNPVNGWQMIVTSGAPNESAVIKILDFAESPSELADFMHEYGIGHIHMHHFAGYIEKAIDYFRLASSIAGLRYDVTIHDFMPYCPRITLIDDSGSYCGEPDMVQCQSCISRNGSDFGKPVVWEWRDRYLRLFKEARRIFVPSFDTASRISSKFDGVSVTVRPHQAAAHLEENAARPAVNVNIACRPSQSTLRVATLGSLGPHKGSGTLVSCASFASDNKIPIEFVVVGETDREHDLHKLSNVVMIGKYCDEELLSIISKIGPDVLWFPAVWPETFSYTLSAAFKSGVLPVAFDLGAQSERIRKLNFGKLVPTVYIDNPEKICEILLECKTDNNINNHRSFADARYADILNDYYSF